MMASALGLPGFFVAGTDTGVGKTVFSVALVSALHAQGRRVVGLKPLAAGRDPKLAPSHRNEDALLLQAAASVSLPYEVVNPVYLDQAIAPHIAAAIENRELSAAECLDACQHSAQLAVSAGADTVIVESAGGWMVPLNEKETVADFARGLQLPVILVVGMRLGCLNHALLTVEAIHAAGLPLAAWVANGLQADMPFFEENIDSLRQRIEAPLLAVLPYMPAADTLASCLSTYQSLAAELSLSQLSGL